MDLFLGILIMVVTMIIICLYQLMIKSKYGAASVLVGTANVSLILLAMGVVTKAVFLSFLFTLAIAFLIYLYKRRIFSFAASMGIIAVNIIGICLLLLLWNVAP